MVIGEMGGGNAGTQQSGQDEATIQLRLRHMEVQLRQAESDRARAEEEGSAKAEAPEGASQHPVRQVGAAAPAQTAQSLPAAPAEAGAGRAFLPRFDSFSPRTTEESIGLYKVTRNEGGKVSVEME